MTKKEDVKAPAKAPEVVQQKSLLSDATLAPEVEEQVGPEMPADRALAALRPDPTSKANQALAAQAVADSPLATPLNSLLMVDPQAAMKYLQARADMLTTLGRLALAQTRAQDWTLFKDGEGHIVAVLRDSGAVKVREFFGISIFNHRDQPDPGGHAQPKLTSEEVDTLGYNGPTGKRHKVTLAEMWADGRCALTGEEIVGIPFGIRDKNAYGKDNFAGRGTPEDLAASCRTGLDKKVVAILSGLRKVDVEALKEAGIDYEKCFKGHGFGSATERAASGVAGDDVKAEAKKIRDEILARVGGDEAAARQLLVEITSWTNDKGEKVRGIDTTARFAKMAAIKHAWDRLRAHGTFGDKATSRDPGQEG